MTEERDDYRCYHFTNMYLSTMSHGIQSAHGQTELSLEFRTNGPKNKKSGMWYKWAKENKTTIVLNAGYNSRMLEIKEFFEREDNPFPWSYFNESEAALGGLLTNVAIVLPKRIYETAEKIRTREYQVYSWNDSFAAYSQDEKMNSTPGNFSREYLTQFEVDLIEVLNSCGLAK